MRKTFALLKSTIVWLDNNKRIIGAAFAALVTLVGIDTVTQTSVIPESVTPPVIQTVIDSGG